MQLQIGRFVSLRSLISVRSAARSAMIMLDADPRIKFSDVAKQLGVEVGAPDAPVFMDGLRVDDAADLQDCGLRDGSRVEFGESTTNPMVFDGIVDLCVSGGMGAGNFARLSIGETTVQVDELGQLHLDGSRERTASLAVLVAMDGKVQVRLAAVVRGQFALPRLDTLEGPLTASDEPWPPGAILFLGASALTVQPTAHADADLLPSSQVGRVDYNRPPRLLPPMPTTNYRLPAPPPNPPRDALPWLAAALPAVLGIVTALVFRSPAFLLFALATPLMVLGNWMVSRRHGVTSHRVLLKQHSAERAALQEEIHESVRREQHQRRMSSPGAAELRLIANTPTRRLWERRPTDPDHLHVRLGLSDASSHVDVEDMAEPEHRRKSRGQMAAVPVIVSLQEAGVVGVAGPGPWPRRRAAWMLGQLGLLQSPRDVQMYVLAASTNADEWVWASWLPHMRPALGQDAVALFGTTVETTAARVSELAQIISERRAAANDLGPRESTFTPSIVVVLDGARRLRSLPGVVSVLRDGPSVGVRVICLDGDEQQLPEECTAVVLARPEGGMLLRRQNTDDVEGILPDELTHSWFDEVARVIAPLHDVTASNTDSLIPDSARLVEVLGAETIEADQVAAKWQLSRGTTEAIVGVSLDGPFSLDLVRDGPHGLVAGTTGSGKSEFLQTLVASLALANSPATMNFVLVDYKGGAAFSQCALLPHTVGMVTDLDSHLVERALTSLRAELTYRERILATAAAKDLEDYLEAQRRGNGGPTLPRLTIVIDEFAAMAKELPDFVSGLVSIAQRGRSLGIHLILATQRPSGVISAEIRANTNLRVALRMTDRSESTDVIETADAAGIAKSQPGRAFARLGHTSLIPFQTARVGGRRLNTAITEQLEPALIIRLSPDQLGAPAPQRAITLRHVADDTDLSALVATLSSANQLLGLAAPRSPWLPPLSTQIGLNHLPTPGKPASFAWGLEDLPSSQLQTPATIDLDTFGHMYVIGAPGSGRSTALRTIAASAASQIDARSLHIYGIDCGNGALAVLDELPHAGAIVQRSQTERTVRLIAKLRTELGIRQQLLGRGNHADISEQREHAGAGDALSHVLVVIDRWENFSASFSEVDGGILIDVVQELLRDGATAGIHLVIAGDRALLSSRMSVLTDDMLILRLTDRLDYSMAGINHRSLPEHIPAGRGFRSINGREIQTAILGEDASGRGQTSALRSIAATLGSRILSDDGGPFRVDDLPASIDLVSAYALAGAESKNPLWAMLGVGGDQTRAVGMDLAGDAPTFIIGGPAKSGRSTMLHTMAESLLRSGTELVIATPRASPLKLLEGRKGVRRILLGTMIEELDLDDVLRPDGKPVAFIIDDAELLTEAPAAQWLRDYIRTASDNQRGLVLAGDSNHVAGGFSGWQVDAKKNRRGALLSPQSVLDGELVGVRLPRSSVAMQITPGLAFVHLGSGELQTVLVPTVPIGFI